MLFIKKVLYWEWTDCSIPEETPAKTTAEAINGCERPPCDSVKQVRQCTAGGPSQREIWWFRQTDGLHLRKKRKKKKSKERNNKERKHVGTQISNITFCKGFLLNYVQLLYILKASAILALPFEPYATIIIIHYIIIIIINNLIQWFIENVYFRYIFALVNHNEIKI